MKLGVARWTAWWAEVAPERPAIVFDGKAISYGELDEQVRRLSAALAHAGVGRGDRVAVLLSNRPEFLVAFFAAARLGAILVPLNVRLVARELAYIVGDAQPRVLISEPAFEESVAALRDDSPVECVVTLDPGGVGETFDAFLAAAGDDPAPLDPGGEIVICYTSGTTGLPKGAVLTDENLLWGGLQEIVAFGMRSDDRHLVAVPLCFTGGLITASLPVFHTGATLYLERGFDPDAALRRIVDERITRMMGVPTMFAALAAHPDFDEADIGCVRTFLVGGAPIPPALVERYHAAGAAGFTNAYGLTEGGGFNLFLPAEEVTSRSGAYRPAIYSEPRVVDEAGAPVAAGEAGELLLRGPSVMKGYWRDDAATAEALRDGWLHTGDLVRVDEEGCLYPIDRVKDMIITGGLNVYPAEVEHALFAHPKLLVAAVIGLPEERWGEAVTVIAVAKPGEEVGADEIIAACAAAIADYKRPKDVIFVEEIPRNASGKVLKRELRERFAGHYAGVPAYGNAG